MPTLSEMLKPRVSFLARFDLDFILNVAAGVVLGGVALALLGGFVALLVIGIANADW